MTCNVMYREYQYNKKFKNYVDKYSNNHHISVEEALRYSLVIRWAYLCHTEV